jgi:hypothetical protein
MTARRRVSTVVVRPLGSQHAMWFFPSLPFSSWFTQHPDRPNLLSIGFIFERNYNEGWNVYSAQRLMDRELIYDSDYWRINNYPIFSFLLVVGVYFIVHNLLLSGRIIALVSFVAVGILAAAATRCFGGDRVERSSAGAVPWAFVIWLHPAGSRPTTRRLWPGR